MSSVDRIEPRRGVDPAAPLFRVRKRERDEERPRDEPEQEQREPRRDERAEDDGLPHVDVLA